MIAHKAVSELFERHLDMMNQHLYENVEFKAQPLSPGGESVSVIPNGKRQCTSGDSKLLLKSHLYV